MSEYENICFEIMTPLGFYVRVTNPYWQLIVTIKHPIMNGCETQVKETLEGPMKTGEVVVILMSTCFTKRKK